ncbi:MAG: HD domain-containing protein [Anaerolineales bacterium]|nr:HD domain-containing protein [Anaerolineales bacterium]
MELFLTHRFTEALGYATQLHADQFRKGTHIPYIAHLLGVTALVLDAGGDEDQAIAALLHDAVEDQGGLDTLVEIQRCFGESVAFIVKSCSDAFVQPKPPWLRRKKEYIAHLWDAPPQVRLVSLADKLHNARSILTDLRNHGLAAFDKFKGGKSGTQWYYKSLVEVFTAMDTNDMVAELARVVTQIQDLVNQMEKNLNE